MPNCCRRRLMSQVKSSWQTALYDPQLMFCAFRLLKNQVTGKLNYAHVGMYFIYRGKVFDKDDNEDFNEAIQLAEKAGFQCAWSNESFELWFCLHFIGLRMSVSRCQYIDILEREIRRHIPEFTYKKGGDVMYDILRKYGSQENAVLRAQNLRLAYSGTDYASHNPCTTVDILVDKLKK